jgi:hypothetical protein
MVEHAIAAPPTRVVAKRPVIEKVRTAGGLVVVKLLDGFTPVAGDTFSLMDFGSFANNGIGFDFSQAALPADLWWDTTQFANTGSISVIIPEPTAIVLLAAALAGFCAVRCWRKRIADWKLRIENCELQIDGLRPAR